MTLADLLEHYGAAAIFVGAGLEGETAAFLGGVLAHRHLVSYWQAALAAAAGSFVADQLWFYAGRYAGRMAIVRRFTAAPAMARVTAMLEAYPNAFIFAFRFIYGIRTVSPVAIGLSKVSARRFILINLLAAACWGVVITAIGYLFGNAVESLIGRLRLDRHLILAIAACLLLIGLFAVFVRRRLTRAS